MYNMKDSLPAACQGQTIQVIAKIVSATLDLDAVNRMATLLPQIQTNGTTVSETNNASVNNYFETEDMQ